jgi:murein DD-endopeptidase MepM/ murein hydrolase activator NlpD
MGNPVPGHGVTYPYGVRDSDYAAGHHTGEDYACDVGTKVVAPWDARIVGAGWGVWGSAYGYQVVGESKRKGRTIRWATCHMSALAVHTGMRVGEGDFLGHSGETGNVTGPHVHYEERTSPYLYADQDIQPQLSHNEPASTERVSPWSHGDVYVSRLHQGEKNSDSVRRLQWRLLDHPKVPAREVSVNGHYDAGTVSAVQHWQREVYKADDNRDGSHLGNPQANQLFGQGYRVVEEGAK